MLRELRIQNFKSWQDTGHIRLAPLTGFFGTNSSGKTALLQMLLLMKQTTESNDSSILFHTGDEKSYVDVGSLYDVAHKKQIPQEISVEVVWFPEEPSTYDYSFLSNPEYGENRYYNFPYITVDYLEFKFTLCLNKEIFLKSFQYDFGAITSSEGGDTVYTLGLERTLQGKYKLISQSFDYQFIEFTEKLSDEHFLQPAKFYEFSDISNSYILNSANVLFSNIPILLENQLADINYLGPLRDYPHRIYLWSGQKPQNVGSRGELTIPALLAAKPEVSEKVATWLQKLGLIHSFKLQPLAVGRREHETVVQIVKDGPEVLLTEVGFGISQVLPVLTLCYYVPENSILLFEQPEIHLHPKVQAGLADLFIEVIHERKLQIILESHSEHFLYRLERRIAEEEFSNEEAALYFCRQDDTGVSHLEELELDTYGNILNWPENFFGDPLGDKLAQNQAQIQQKLKEKKEKEAAKNAGNS